MLYCSFVFVLVIVYQSYCVYCVNIDANGSNITESHQIGRQLQYTSDGWMNLDHKRNYDKGYLMCGCDRLKGGILRTHYQLRHIWKSNLPIAIGHCDELSDAFLKFLLAIDPSIIIMNLCPSDIRIPFKRSYIRRLRGYFCKPAALARTPFNHTMLLDTDTIWFSSPEKLFYSEYYTTHGAFFFRDKFVDMGWGNFPNADFYETYYQKVNNQRWPTKQEALTLFKANGINLYWGQHAFPGKFPKLGHYQDSSCTMIHKDRHPRFFEQLELRLFNDNLGFGDKEMFWTSCVLGKENFFFEPFLVSMNGDCDLLLVHWDPHDAVLPDPTRAAPLYMNGEFMLEEARFIGDMVRFELTLPILASEVLTNQSKALRPFWVPQKPRGQGYDCVCAKNSGYTCRRISNSMYHLSLLMQWISLTAKLSGDGPSSDCIRISAKHIDALNHVFASKLSRKDCPLIGCPLLPIEVNKNLKLGQDGSFCDPVSFELEPSEQLKRQAAVARGYRLT